MRYELHYSVQEDSNGFVYPLFLESEELAYWDNSKSKKAYEKSYVGTFYLETNSKNMIIEKRLTKLDYLLRMVLNYYPRQDIVCFMKTFYKDTMPEVVVEDKGGRKTHYNIKDSHTNKVLNNVSVLSRKGSSILPKTQVAAEDHTERLNDLIKQYYKESKNE